MSVKKSNSFTFTLTFNIQIIPFPPALAAHPSLLLFPANQFGNNAIIECRGRKRHSPLPIHIASHFQYDTSITVVFVWEPKVPQKEQRAVTLQGRWKYTRPGTRRLARQNNNESARCALSHLLSTPARWDCREIARIIGVWGIKLVSLSLRCGLRSLTTSMPTVCLHLNWKSNKLAFFIAWVAIKLCQEFHFWKLLAD